jgi:hypothetical protein
MALLADRANTGLLEACRRVSRPSGVARRERKTNQRSRLGLPSARLRCHAQPNCPRSPHLLSRRPAMAFPTGLPRARVSRSPDLQGCRAVQGCARPPSATRGRHQGRPHAQGRVHFISGLIGAQGAVTELGADVDPFVLHLFAALAQKEQQLISKRTRIGGRIGGAALIFG